MIEFLARHNLNSLDLVCESYSDSKPGDKWEMCGTGNVSWKIVEEGA
jgi:hypothetical protein